MSGEQQNVKAKDYEEARKKSDNELSKNLMAIITVFS
jgi:hypothetical protein